MSGYTIRIFVADGDPDGLRIIDQMNWTGKGIVFPRNLWTKVRERPEFGGTGVYILVGYGEGDEDLPRIYVGEGDGIRDRINQHFDKKGFWTWAVAFTGALNKAHVQWLEHRLVALAKLAGQCNLENGNTPQAPYLSEHELADVAGFLEHMLRILPLIRLGAFEKPKPVAVSDAPPRPIANSTDDAERDTIVVPAKKDGFDRVFMGEQAWWAIRVGGAMLDKIKYCAVYQTAPISAVTHVARVKLIEPYGDGGKFRLVFAEPANALRPIPLADTPAAAVQGPRYTNFAKLSTAKKSLIFSDRSLARCRSIFSCGVHAQRTHHRHARRVTPKSSYNAPAVS
jgi:hypothetical protein